LPGLRQPRCHHGDDGSKLRFTLEAAPTGVLAVQRKTYLPVQQATSNAYPRSEIVMANIYRAAPIHIPSSSSCPTTHSIHSRPHLQAGLLSNTSPHSNPFSSSRLRIHPHVDFYVSNSLSCCSSQRSRPFGTQHLWLLELRRQLVPVPPTRRWASSGRLRVFCCSGNRLLEYGRLLLDTFGCFC